MILRVHVCEIDTSVSTSAVSFLCGEILEAPLYQWAQLCHVRWACNQDQQHTATHLKGRETGFEVGKMANSANDIWILEAMPLPCTHRWWSKGTKEDIFFTNEGKMEHLMKHSWRIGAATAVMQTLYQTKFAVKKSRALNPPGDLYSTPYLPPQTLVSDWEDKIDPWERVCVWRGCVCVCLMLLSIKKASVEVVQASD